MAIPDVFVIESEKIRGAGLATIVFLGTLPSLPYSSGARSAEEAATRLLAVRRQPRRDSGSGSAGWTSRAHSR